MAGFTQWYLRTLKSRPLLTNLGSGVVLMTLGDGCAQEIERHRSVPGHSLAEVADLEGVPSNQRLHMKPYGRPAMEEEDVEVTGSVLYNTSIGDMKYKWQEATRLMWDGFETELKEFDYFRTATMVGWSVGYMTPFFLYFYNVMDRIFPKQTPFTIGARVLASFLVSIPTNAIFFVYGTSVHHVAEWIALRQDWREDMQELRLKNESAIVNDDDEDEDEEPMFDLEMMMAKSILKVKSELVNTISASAKAWIPINLFNFSLVPSHLRPLVFMTASVFWNCYLSLVQHRDVALPASAAETVP